MLTCRLFVDWQVGRRERQLAEKLAAQEEEERRRKEEWIFLVWF